MEYNDKSKEKVKLNESEKKLYLKEKLSLKIQKLKELIKSLWVDNISDLLKFLEGIESALDWLDLVDLEKVTQEIHDEITIAIEKDNRIKSWDKLKIAMILNWDSNVSNDDFLQDHFSYL